MSQLLVKPKRLFPFIVSIGDTFHIIADRQPLVSPKNSAEALIDLLCVYYVFNIKYSPEVKPALLLLQTHLLGIEDGETKRSKTLGIFMKMFQNIASKKRTDLNVEEENAELPEEDDCSETIC